MSETHVPTTRPPANAPDPAFPLYDPRFEHDACGTGFVAFTDGRSSREALDLALHALERLRHRGAVAADGVTGDGTGVMTDVPWAVLEQELPAIAEARASGERPALAMVFFADHGSEGMAALEEAAAACGLRFLAWRDVPMDPSVLGPSARAEAPVVRQAVVAGPAELREDEVERLLFRLRRTFEAAAPEHYVCSLSSRTVVYKAMCPGDKLADFYLDLRDGRFVTRFSLFHQRYSTNTVPTWRLAQPFRFVAHNGEINTISANRMWMNARAGSLPDAFRPPLSTGVSDSASLDEALELLLRGGRGLDHALSMLVVPAWEASPTALPADQVHFYRYSAAAMEPWDGPAALAFSDGRFVGACLDRNGLRPCRYTITADGMIAAASEVGVFGIEDARVSEKGRLGPGQILLVDLATGRVAKDHEVRAGVAARLPYRQWLGAEGLEVDAEAPAGTSPYEPAELAALQVRFGVTAEDSRFVLKPMAEDGKEPTWSMGDDTPVAPLARAPRSVYSFLRQRFAQVTNPPIDPLREAAVMSLRTWIGPLPELLEDGPQPRVIELESPVVTPAIARALRTQTALPAVVVSCTFDPTLGIPYALDRVCAEAEQAVREDCGLVILSDREVGPQAAPIPMALALGAVHHHLLRAELRGRVGLLAEAGDCVDVHHVAVLLGYGASAVHPWLLFERQAAEFADSPPARLAASLETSLRKILSKMGIATISSYRGGQIFEVLGLADEVVDRCFTGTANRIGGLGWDEITATAVARHERVAGFDAEAPEVPDHGAIRYRRGDDTEAHAWQPLTVRALQGATGSARRPGDRSSSEWWEEYGRLIAEGSPSTLRDLLDCVEAGRSIPLEEVEPASSIVQRFVVSAMSLGALSPEAHQTLTVAMNRLGARSNTGEGGEDPAAYRGGSGADRLDAKIKQIASGRFGVTGEYLINADEIEIKMAQGSKPGEGGQLPGHKVTELIARLRHAQPGRPLISPPPHHDIYSIEDLAQLIHDLKGFNPRARIGVKLVAEAGVGTIAAGVAKAYADYIVISGHSGGTGASPLSSIKNAGVPWELGLAETQQTLVRSALRSRVRLRTDGGLMTSLDVLLAALLGAEEFGFGTAPLVAMGCDMARQCHLNSCPAGIATQRPELRARFRGKPEQVERFFLLLAEDVRNHLARLGLASVDEAIGRTDLLRQVGTSGRLDLSRLLVRAQGDHPRCTQPRNDPPPPHEQPWDHTIVEEAVEAVAAGGRYEAEHRIGNEDRSFGARLGGALAGRFGSEGLPAGSVDLRLNGTAGQSFGAFCGRGVRLTLEGEANDYVGKGLCGAELVLRPPRAVAERMDGHVLLGNVALYGATSGTLNAAGVAGERFAVRNSGADAVVEGIGEHGCEYMTGGCVVVLGPTGGNFGAGMTGGMAFVYDRAQSLPDLVNARDVCCEAPDGADLERLHGIVTEHRERTGSVRAARILTVWEKEKDFFWKVAPLGAIEEREEQDDAENAEASRVFGGSTLGA